MGNIPIHGSISIWICIIVITEGGTRIEGQTFTQLLLSHSFAIVGETGVSDSNSCDRVSVRCMSHYSSTIASVYLEPLIQKRREWCIYHLIILGSEMECCWKYKCFPDNRWYSQLKEKRKKYFKAYYKILSCMEHKFGQW